MPILSGMNVLICLCGLVILICFEIDVRCCVHQLDIGDGHTMHNVTISRINVYISLITNG